MSRRHVPAGAKSTDVAAICEAEGRGKEAGGVRSELQRCRDEQKRCSAEILAGHPEQHGLRIGLADWFAEDLILSGLWLTERPELAHDTAMKYGSVTLPGSGSISTRPTHCRKIRPAKMKTPAIFAPFS